MTEYDAGDEDCEIHVDADKASALADALERYRASIAEMNQAEQAMAEAKTKAMRALRTLNKTLLRA